MRAVAAFRTRWDRVVAGREVGPSRHRRRRRVRADQSGGRLAVTRSELEKTMNLCFRVVCTAIGVLAAVSLARAQETPSELTRAERSCEISAVRSVTGFVIRASDCIVECFGRPGQHCFSLNDAQTAACLDTARNQSKIRVLRDCSGFDCPECYAGGTACDDFVNFQMSQALTFTDAALNLLFCDDSFSGDGLSRAEQRCQAGLAQTAARHVKKLQECFARCERDVGSGQIADPSACDASNLDRPGFDPTTQACVDQARARFASSCTNKCADPPDCFRLTCGEAELALEQEILQFEPVLFCADVPPPVCGDGRISGGEACDPLASPNGCPDGYSCFGCFFCEPPPPPCGNGVIDPGEACDFNAFPTGCGAGLVCSGDCTACIVPPAGFCVPTSPDTCTAGLHGCLQPCDNNTPGSACVSTSPGGAFLCVQEECTFRTCNSAADCDLNEVCFTEGCCGSPALATSASIDGWR